MLEAKNNLRLSHLLLGFKEDSYPIFLNASSSITSIELLDKVLQVASQLKAYKEEKWVICYNNTIDFTIDLLALFLAKKIPVLLPNCLPGTLETFSTHFDCVLDHTQLNKLPEEDLSANKAQLLEDLKLDDDQTFIIFTSGSSGQAKEITKTLFGVSCELSAIEDQFGGIALSDYQFISSVQPQHLYGLTFYLFWPLVAKRLIHAEKIQYEEQLIKYISKPTVFISSPGLLSRFVEMPLIYQQEKLVIFSSGSLLKEVTAKKIKALYHKDIIEIFGSSETGVIAFRRQLDNVNWKIFNKVKISQNDCGALVVRSPFFYQEGDDELIMSDQVEVISSDQFKLLDRLDRTVKVEGKRLSLPFLEKLIQEFYLVEEAYCLLLENHREYIASVIILSKVGKTQLLNNGKRYINEQINQFLSAYIDRSLLPKKYRYLDALPINEQSKVELSKIKELFK
ncbi:acyl--CoA ligase [Thiotrichales bacterium 19S9-12]|nr:acyl--CoA ligase [Thiotrichales bacterium 19S9-11]MCF6810799.1 acyl--CoA ligase [Thiotrichales bacterium 19S9-12]